MKNIIFDIETAPLPDSELLPLMPEFEASKVLKDPEKIKADIEKKRQEWIDDAALKANTGRVVAIGFLEDDQVKIEDDLVEDLMIQKFWQKYEATELTQFVGHYIKGFDIPFLMRRSWILGIKIPFGLINGRYLGGRFIDTMEVWGCGNFKETISLDNISKAFGLSGKSGNGSDFHKLLKSDRPAAIAYLTNDLMMTKVVASKLGLI